ncbi:MAG: 50S ribosomal protein L22 [Omnitrophica bacterium GWA2_52_8]|nr:MAG: 50S ribosomal protein L22 [Omnitrophica bacterium GWA2_52_8]
MSPRKMRLVIDTVRRQPIPEAFARLMALPNKGARFLEKLIASAAANAKVLGMDSSRLYVAEVRADGGPTMKRHMSRSMGRADVMLKRMTHVSVVLKEGERKWETPGGPLQAEEQESDAKAKTKAPAKKLGKKKAAAGAAA